MGSGYSAGNLVNKLLGQPPSNEGNSKAIDMLGGGPHTKFSVSLCMVPDDMEEGFRGDVMCIGEGLQLQMQVLVSAGWLKSCISKLDETVANSYLVGSLVIPIFDDEDPFDV